MKRKGLIRHLERHGCEFLREGANHTVYINRIKTRERSRLSQGMTRSSKTYVEKFVRIWTFHCPHN